MLFNSLSYAIFLPCVFIFYWLLPSKYRWVLLLASSYYFYMSWNAKYVILIASTTIVSYWCAIVMEKTSDQKKKKFCLAAALIVSLGLLFVFKYFNFTIDLVAFMIPVNVKRLNCLLPVGISFYTFQTLSYVIDVYRGRVKAEKHLGIYATFVAFFPQLVAGPIERTSNLLPQIKQSKSFDYGAASYGTRLIVLGLYKKMVIADNLAIYADQVFSDIRAYRGFSLVIAAIFFSFQIYCDFSGYSDIARGSAKLLNIDLMENFKSPYYSSSVREFWSRWHISLSTWFRDYVYIPMGGNRVPKIHNVINLLVTFLISGLWHGANLTFVAWGGLHGCGQVTENLLKVKKIEKRNIIWWGRVIFVFVFVTVLWVFFRATTISDAVYVLKNIIPNTTGFTEYFVNGIEELNFSKSSVVKIITLYLFPIAVYDYCSLKSDVIEWIGKKNVIFRYLYLTAVIIMIIAFGYVGQSTFVYFQF